MLSVIVRSSGGPVEVADVPVPVPGVGQVRVRVGAAAVNPVDFATRSGALHAAGLVPARVVGLGWDVAGVVDAVGADVSFSVGDAVVGLRDRLPTLGTQAEFVVLDASAVARAPRSVSLEAASTLPLGGLTAWQALDLLDLPVGASVLVTGAGGSVGGFAVQLAVARGLRVVAFASGSDEELVRSYGASWVVPRGADVGAAVREVVPGGVDGVVDAAALGVEALDAVRGGGAFVAVLGSATPVALRGIRVANVWIRADGVRLASLVELVDAGAVRLAEPEAVPLADVARVHDEERPWVVRDGVRRRVVLVPPAVGAGRA
ncbi:NADP-dependent oxidoreductase [Saccharothrix variisporea]|uniref:NADPH:quinone reductase-like Zn-dependent oxidoreductase n=1 Tax=Saccharothrix variisporea TaxID=543527 RepID=A0A495XLU1_9PSEU|nr:NADP-dependent oxidoreductase [Saccharothrix variisporea]RKT73423.1 NADPH:quinone reductase-like Zn-dependent oxidoreductase [Saccharothrix variisporea]